MSLHYSTEIMLGIVNTVKEYLELLGFLKRSKNQQDILLLAHTQITPRSVTVLRKLNLIVHLCESVFPNSKMACGRLQYGNRKTRTTTRYVYDSGADALR